MMIGGSRVLVTGGTGSLGKAVVRRLLERDHHSPDRITVFSRDEAKQHDMRLEFMHRVAATDDVIYRNSKEKLRFRIGDVRDQASLEEALQDVDIVIHAAALKQVPTCEYAPFEAVQTNIIGSRNLVSAIRNGRTNVSAVVGISTDKACEPINVMGMTKAVMERILVEANLKSPTRFLCVRYGNVIASRGSVVPLFLEQISSGGPITITTEEMTRFFLSLDRAVDTILAALASGAPGEIWVPRVESARIVDVARALIGARDIAIEVTGIRPGEKVHEVMVSREECYRTVSRDAYYAIRPMLPELANITGEAAAMDTEYSSRDHTVTGEALRNLLRPVLGSGPANETTP